MSWWVLRQKCHCRLSQQRSVSCRTSQHPAACRLNNCSHRWDHTPHHHNNCMSALAGHSRNGHSHLHRDHTQALASDSCLNPSQQQQNDRLNKTSFSPSKATAISIQSTFSKWKNGKYADINWAEGLPSKPRPGQVTYWGQKLEISHDPRSEVYMWTTKGEFWLCHSN